MDKANADGQIRWEKYSFQAFSSSVGALLLLLGACASPLWYLASSWLRHQGSRYTESRQITSTGHARAFARATANPAMAGLNALMMSPATIGAIILHERSMARMLLVSLVRTCGPASPAASATAQWFSTEILLASDESLATQLNAMMRPALKGTLTSPSAAKCNADAALRAARAIPKLCPANAATGVVWGLPRSTRPPTLAPRSICVSCSAKAKVAVSCSERPPPRPRSKMPAENSHMRSPQAEAKCEV
mmetsp:Transcript_27725/g.92144  ORF Transcript_27725/g.92144 Transcript_27725/m.92144 type:complete len:249 (+) Transcript_27725:606-1352(+)